MTALTSKGFMRQHDGNEYTDYTKPLYSFRDALDTEVEMRVTFSHATHDAYVVFYKTDDNGDTVELGECELSLTWDAAIKAVGEEPNVKIA